MFNHIKRYIDYLIIEHEGGNKTSKHARALARKKGVEIGLHTYGSCFDDSFNVGGKVYIGRYCSIGPNVKYFGGNHPMNYASMSPYFYRREWGYNVEDITRKDLHIGNDVWIGCGTIITSSCRIIGNGAVIGAGAIVTKDIPPYAVVMGVPAKVTKFRFPQEVQDKLERSKWWEKEPDQLIKFYDLISCPIKWAEEIMKND